MRQSRTRLGVVWLIGAVLGLALARPAVAGIIVLSGDSNIGNALTGSFGAPVDAGNQQFFANVLQGGSAVLVLDNIQGGSVGLVPGDINSYYNSLGGVTSSLYSGAVSDATLAGVDLFVASLPDDPFTASEIAALNNFLGGGGSVFFLGDNSAFGLENATINATLVALGSSLAIVNDLFDAGFQTATGAQITADPLTTGVGTFTYAAPSRVTGGTVLFFGSAGQPFLTYETVSSVPEPAGVVLLGVAVGVVAFLRKRRWAS